MCTHVSVCRLTYGGQRATFGGWLSPSTLGFRHQTKLVRLVAQAPPTLSHLVSPYPRQFLETQDGRTTSYLRLSFSPHLMTKNTSTTRRHVKYFISYNPQRKYSIQMSVLSPFYRPIHQSLQELRNLPIAIKLQVVE